MMFLGMTTQMALLRKIRVITIAPRCVRLGVVLITKIHHVFLAQIVEYGKHYIRRRVAKEGSRPTVKQSRVR
jgi:hypothetical protein